MYLTCLTLAPFSPGSWGFLVLFTLWLPPKVHMASGQTNNSYLEGLMVVWGAWEGVQLTLKRTSGPLIQWRPPKDTMWGGARWVSSSALTHSWLLVQLCFLFLGTRRPVSSASYVPPSPISLSYCLGHGVCHFPLVMTLSAECRVEHGIKTLAPRTRSFPLKTMIMF